MTTKSVSQKQIDLITKHAAALSALGITLEDAQKDTWRASGSLGRVLDPSSQVLTALRELGARPFFAKSSREAEMQLTVLRALSDYFKNRDPEAMVAALKTYFMKRETA